MAVRSPITIGSSSPNAFSLPTISPPSHHRPEACDAGAASSSPKLPSPRTFVRTSAPRDKPASDRERLPGSARSSAPWAERVDSETHKEHEQQSPDAFGPREARAHMISDNARRGTDKLKRPRESVGELKRPSTTKAGDASEEFFQSREAVPEVQTSVHLIQIPSESALDGPRKSGKHAENKGPRRGRKPKVKSKAIILDSDEPESLSPFDDKVVAEKQRQDQVADKTGFNAAGRAAKPRQGRQSTKRKLPARDQALPQPQSIPRLNDQVAHADGKRETSAHFATSPARSKSNDHDATKSGIQRECPRQDEKSTILSNDMAPRRRRSWTPTTDTVPGLPDAHNEMTCIMSGPDDKIGQRPLSDLLGHFSYNHQEDLPPPRVACGKAGIKRRRIELSEPPVPLAVLQPRVNCAKPAKKTKSTKKKPQTITALATAAYHPPDKVIADQHIVSEFFASRTDAVELPRISKTGVAAAKSKPRKPRVSRAKASDKDPVEKPKKTPKVSSKKAHVKFAEVHHPLLSPSQARGQLRHQQFVFGTSSQLAAEETPALIGRIQQAILESEAVPASQTAPSPSTKSYVKVPTAPHGTSLTVGQADRELWCVSARDLQGRTVLEESDAGGRPACLESQILQESIKLKQGLSYDPAEPALVAEDALPSDIPAPTDTKTNSGVEGRAATGHDGDDDSFFLIQSDDSPLEGSISKNAGPFFPSPGSERPLAELPLKLSYLSNPVPSAAQRTVLRALDANLDLRPQAMHVKSSSALNARQLSTAAWNHASSQAKPLEKLPKPRGRPRKDAGPSLLEIPAKKPRGRPRKTAPDSITQPASTTEWLPMSQPEPQSDWLNIDEISDSDSPATPSPPRRRASSSPRTVHPLELAAAAVIPNRDEGDSQMQHIWSVLFPKISSTVRSTPPSNNAANPTWHEKILLFDPIVIEDLTAWLNQEGLKVCLRRAKSKPRGRKRKDGIEPEVEHEEIEEDLRPWMVQKWCEAMSICCLWKEGLRGGVRTRY